MLNRFVGVDDIWVTEQFAGAGGSGSGMMAVPGVRVDFAANHDAQCKATYIANHNVKEYWLGDVQAEDAIEKFPYAPFFWSSPACPRFTTARGDKRFFDKENQMALWAEELTEDQKAGVRSRALMEEVVTYLRHCQEVYGRPVLGFGIENVKEARLWAHWDRWIAELRKLGYIHLRVIAINAMHVQPRATLPVPQSRNRLLVAGVHESVGRAPDWDKWLRPYAYCPSHDGWIQAMQSWKKIGQDMGVYGIKTGQYVYVCPLHSCRGQLVEPPVLSAVHCIDWFDLGTPIGDRPKTPRKPRGMEQTTLERIEAGIVKRWGPFLTPTGGTWNNEPYSVDEPTKTLTTRENTALVVPLEGRPGKVASYADEAMRTLTTRRETGLAFPELPEPFVTLFRSARARNMDPKTDPIATIVADGSNHGLVVPPDGPQPLVIPMRGGGDKLQARRADIAPAHTVTGGGLHHGMVIPPGFVMRNNGSKGDGSEHCTPFDEAVRTVTTTGHQSLVTMPEPLLMPYYGNGTVAPASEPVGTLPTRDRWALLTSDGRINIDKVRFRMLKVPELQRAQSLPAGYRFGPKDQRTIVRQIGNAVPPPMSEILTCAVVEAILGIELERFAGPNTA
ncbi:DNA cytosine methyltransferase [Streptosporangium canum]|uniref:DNA cytosine methyltransferase n=1 Tax=Streptosporangium canum TaxID=324952 RepID=UPI0037BB83E1